ncbi:MAG: phasin family protein [Chloroflexi bacterium]|nr:phasin family protein [Chloroflexota bacterium]
MESESNTLLEAVRRVLMASVGAVVLAQEEIEEFVNKLIDRGEIAERDGRKLINDVVENRKNKAQETKQTTQEEFDKRLGRYFWNASIFPPEAILKCSMRKLQS